VAKPDKSDNVQFQAMLAMIGEKCRQKFTHARDVFRFVDTDHSGSVSRSECRFFFRFFNVNQDEADNFFDGFDADEEGEISYTEFVKYLWPHINPGNDSVHWCLKKDEESYQAYQKRHSAPEQVFTKHVAQDPTEGYELTGDLRQARVNIAQRLDLKYKNRKDAFRELDYDRDGTISREEVHFFFRIFGWESVADRFFEHLEMKGNGEVHFHTFAALFNISKDSDLRLRL